jgi:hypothetical protein
MAPDDDGVKARLVYSDGAGQRQAAAARIPGLEVRLVGLQRRLPVAEEALAAAQARVAALRAAGGGTEGGRRRVRVWVLQDGREIEGRSAITCDGVTRITTEGGVVEVKDCDIVDRP